MTDVELVDKYIKLLEKRNWGNRDRLLRKLMEELGEYAEAVEYSNGSSAKIRKFAGKVTPEEKLREEICDVAMMVFALANNIGLKTNDVLRIVHEKLAKHERKHQERC